MKFSSRALSILFLASAPVLPIAISTFAQSAAAIEIADHRSDYVMATRLAYRLASLAENLANGYLSPSPLRPYLSTYEEKIMITDHNSEIEAIADRLHQSASELYHTLRNSRAGLNSLMYDHRDDAILQSFRYVRVDYYDLRRAAAGSWRMAEISRTFSQLSYALTGQSDF